MVEIVKQGPRDAERTRQVLAPWLEERLPGAREVRIDSLVTPEGTGYSNETVFVGASWAEGRRPCEGRYVLRVESPDPPVYPSQTPLERPSVEIQYRAMEAVARTSAVPLAPLVGYEQSPTLLGRPFFVMAFVEGRVPSDRPPYTQAGFLVDAATPPERRRLVESAIEALAEIHAIDWKRADLGWLVPPGTAPGLGVQLELYRSYALSELRGRAHPILERGFEWLDAHFPRERDLALSWGDARIGNMIFADFRPAAVTDWEGVAIAPPEVDLGWWLMYDRFVHESAGAERLDGMPTRDEQRAHYESVSGRRVGDLHYYEVFGAMRYTVVLIRLLDRFAASGLIPAEMNMAVHNVATQILADLLEIPYNWMEPPQ